MTIPSTTLIKLFHDEMRQLTVDSGVSPEAYESVLETDDPEGLRAWLQIISETTYAAVEKVWKLHPRRRWDYYYSMGEMLTEMKLLNRARLKLLTEWRKSSFTKRKKSEPDKNSNSVERVPVQP